MSNNTPFQTPKKNGHKFSIKINSTRNSQSDIFSSITPKVVSFSNYKKLRVEKSSKFGSACLFPSVSNCNKNTSYNVTTISSTSKPPIKNICSDIGKMFNESMSIENKIRKSKLSKSIYYNRFLVKGYEKTLSDSEDESRIQAEEKKDTVNDLIGSCTSRGNSTNRESILKTSNSNSSTPHKVSPVKFKKIQSTTDTSSKIGTVDLIKPRGSEKMLKRRKLTQRMSSLHQHIVALLTV
jgi:hypothetical protein